MPDRYVWTSPQGTAIDFTDASAGYRLLAEGTRGFRSPTYRRATQAYAGVDGVRTQKVSAERRELTLGLLLQAADDDTFRARMRALVRTMNPKRGDGLLTVTSTTGENRRIRCSYEEGLEGDEAPDVTLPGRWWRAIVKLTADDPWFYADPVTVDYGLAAPGVFLSTTLAAFQPLSASTIQGQQTVDLTSSDDGAYPVWTITGPGDSLTLKNLTTGKTLTLTGAIGDGQTVIIDTRRGQQSIRTGTGQRVILAAGVAPSLWPLIDGPNLIEATLSNAGTNSRIRGVFEPKMAGIS